MTKRKGLGVGSVSLILIFSVLCLTIFTLLTVSTAKSDAALAKKAAESAGEYYAADTKAVVIADEIAQSVTGGPRRDVIEGVAIVYEGEAASYVVPIDAGRSISVSLGLNGAILEWKEVSGDNWTPDETIKVYK